MRPSFKVTAARPMQRAMAETPAGTKCSRATAEGKATNSAGKQMSLSQPRLLGEADPDRQAEIRRRPEFDTGMRAIACQCAGGRVVEGSKRATIADIIFQGVETGIERDGQAATARTLKVVAELHALVTKRADIAEPVGLADAGHAQTQAAAFAADKPAVREIVARAAASGVTAAKARKVAVAVPAQAEAWIATEADGPAWDPIGHGSGLGMGRSPAQTERRQHQCESQPV
jgi:hypothetical protein